MISIDNVRARSTILTRLGNNNNNNNKYYYYYYYYYCY